MNYAGAPIILDYELAFGNSPGSVDQQRPVPTSYLDITTVSAQRVFPLTPGTQPGVAIVPLTQRTAELPNTTDNRSTPYIQSFNLSVQHEVMPRLTLEVSYQGNKGTKLYSNVELNTEDIFNNGLLEAFNVTRAGGNAPLFDRILMNRAVPGVGTVNGTTLTGSQAFRRWSSTRAFFATGSVGQFAQFLNRSTALGPAGSMLRNASPALPENFIVASPQYARAELWGNDNNSTYHSLQLQVRKQLSQGFSGQLTYTWSKGMGDALNSAGIRNATNVLDPRDRTRNYGRLSFDRTHGINAHGTWELPFGPNRMFLSSAPGFVQRIVEGWQLSSIASYRSGAPLTITTTTASITSQSGTSVPDIVGAFPKDLGKVQVGNGTVSYFEGIQTRTAPTAGLYGTDPDNLAQFNSNRIIMDANGNALLASPAPGKVGNMGLMWIEGPGRLGLDISLAKRIQLTEGMSFTLRADAANALNSPQWENPNVNVNSVDFGKITNAVGNRTVTINARIDF
jgi:hypothetical protein